MRDQTTGSADLSHDGVAGAALPAKCFQTWIAPAASALADGRDVNLWGCEYCCVCVRMVCMVVG